MATFDPRFLRFLRCSGLMGWFNEEFCKRIEKAFLAAIFAQRCGATFRGKSLTDQHNEGAKNGVPSQGKPKD